MVEPGHWVSFVHRWKRDLKDHGNSNPQYKILAHAFQTNVDSQLFYTLCLLSQEQ